MGHIMFLKKGAIHTVPVNFPLIPTSYALTQTVTQSITYVAPTTGWYMIEDFGASGNGGIGRYNQTGTSSIDTVNAASGGGGGGGGYASSIVKLNKGDTIVIVIGAIGSDTTVTINATTDGKYEVMRVTSGANGGNPPNLNQGGTGGIGGKAYGGNTSNINGGDGGNGNKNLVFYGTVKDVIGGAGGAPANADANVGGAGATVSTFNSNTVNTNGSGKAGFVRIYSGNTNV